MVGLGSLLREKGDEEGGKQLLQEASGMIAAPSESGSIAVRAQATGRSLKRTSSLAQHASWAFQRAPSTEKITSIKQAGQLVKKNLRMLKMAKGLGGLGGLGGGLAASFRLPPPSEDVQGETASGDAANALVAFSSCFLAFPLHVGLRCNLHLHVSNGNAFVLIVGRPKQSMFERTQSAPEVMQSTEKAKSEALSDAPEPALPESALLDACISKLGAVTVS